ncbi:MAG: ligase [Marmoricola sp.]|nr:ligase [Marmoricola sp.]
MLLARTAVWISQRVLRRSGGVIGGRVIVRLVPGAGEMLAAGRRVALVSGTNGKSTSTAMLAAAWATEGPLSTNSDGANTPAGLVWTLANARTTAVVLEVDEAWIPWAIRTFGPEVVVLLNLARDQLHRNPEVGRLARAWRDALGAVPTVVANADDPWVAWAAQTAQRQIWVGAGQIWDEDSLICPECGELLDRTDGWSCTCGHRRPACDWTISDGVIVPPSGSSLSYLTLPGPGNLGNAAQAVAAATLMGADPEAAAAALAGVTAVAGRYATVRVGDHDVMLVLAKNPASWRASLELLATRRNALVLAFNADGADGRDPSWLYDVDFSELRGLQVTLCGNRATDLAVRLEMDGVEVTGQYGDVRGALHALPPGPVDLLATYTAFQDARRELGRAA